MSQPSMWSWQSIPFPFTAIIAIACLSGIALALTLGGCGEADVRPAPDAVADAEPSARDAARSRQPTGRSWLNSLTVRVTGDVDTTLTLDGGNTSVGGGCTGSTPIDLGFHRGNWALPGQPWTNTAFRTADIVGTGETGTFDVEEITWDHGVLERPVGDRTVRLPNRFTGPGTIEIEEHSARSDNRRIRAVLRGSGLSNDDGHSVDIVAEVDLNFSCGVSLMP